MHDTITVKAINIFIASKSFLVFLVSPFLSLSLSLSFHLVREGVVLRGTVMYCWDRQSCTFCLKTPAWLPKNGPGTWDTSLPRCGVVNKTHQGVLKMKGSVSQDREWGSNMDWLRCWLYGDKWEVDNLLVKGMRWCSGWGWKCEVGPKKSKETIFWLLTTFVLPYIPQLPWYLRGC